MLYLMKLSLNFAEEKPEHKKATILADVQKFICNVFDALFLLRIGCIRASVLPDFEKHNEKSPKN